MCIFITRFNLIFPPLPGPLKNPLDLRRRLVKQANRPVCVIERQRNGPFATPINKYSLIAPIISVLGQVDILTCLQFIIKNQKVLATLMKSCKRKSVSMKTASFLINQRYIVVGLLWPSFTDRRRTQIMIATTELCTVEPDTYRIIIPGNYCTEGG